MRLSRSLTSGLLLWGLLFAALFLYSFSAIFIDFSHITDGDTVWWYGAHQYFWENLLDGTFPFWNPFGNGGSPFYFLYAMYRLLDPLMIFPLLVVKLSSSVNLLKLYYQYALFREFFFLLGMGVLAHSLFRSNRILIVLGLLLISLLHIELFSMFRRDAILWLPWLSYFFMKGYQKDSKRDLWIASYVLGVHIGAGSYHFGYGLSFIAVFIIFYSIGHFKEVKEFIGRHLTTLLGNSILVTLLCLPLISTFHDRFNIFPVTRTYGARDEVIETYQKMGQVTIKTPYDAVFIVPSVFNGNYLRLPYLKTYFLEVTRILHGYFLFLLAYFLLFVHFKGKWPLVLSIALLYYFALAKVPVYRFLYDYVFPFNLIRHTIGFAHIAESLLLLLAGFSITQLTFGKPCRWGILPLIAFFLYHFPVLRHHYAPLILLGIAATFFPKFWRGIIVPASLIWAISYDFSSQIQTIKSQLRPRKEIVENLNPTYSELEKKNFSPEPIHWDPIRKFALPRSGYLLFEDLLLKQNVALTSVLEPSKKLYTSEIPYIANWKSGVISNRTIYWPSAYLDPYLIGEKNFPAFMDILGIDRQSFAYYPKQNAISLSHSEQIDFFSHFDYRDLPGISHTTDKILFIENTPPFSDETIYQKMKLYDTYSSSEVPHDLHLLTYNVNTVEIRFRAPHDGYLLFRDSWDPHWSARLDGVPIPMLRANLGYKAIPISTGTHTVQFKYFPLFFGWSVAIYLMIQLLLGGYLMLNLFQPLCRWVVDHSKQWEQEIATSA